MSAELYYLNAGMRQYGSAPVRPYKRQYWEFQAVLSGSIAPSIPNQEPNFRSRCLWLFSPEQEHGWCGRGSETAEIVVFHFSQPDALVRRIHGGLCDNCCVSLAEGDLSWLRQQYHDFADEWRKPSEVTHLKVQRLLIGLELLLLDRLGFQPKLLSTGRDQQRVERVLYWYRQNLHLNPTVADIARVMGVSSVHLRRLFINVSNASPKNVLQDIRMRCIHDYLQNPESTVEGAAAEFGYADASSLTRAYRQCFGHSPRKQR